MAVKYQVIGLKALHWFQSWCEDDNMPYQQNAMDMYDVLEQVIVNDKLPSKYVQHLIPKAEFEKQVYRESYS